MAKRFFFVCAGILCLVVAYQFGAKSARAQGLGSSVIGAMGCGPGGGGPTIALMVDRVTYRATINGSTLAFELLPPLPPLPGTSPVLALDMSCCGFALLENGDVWAGGGGGPPSPWSYLGNVMAASGPTPAQRESFGALKARFRK
jgi:hypothetical protein